MPLPGFCKFCNVSAKRGFNIAYEDESFVAFEDRSPASRYHYLIVPKRHIESVRSLKQSDVQLVKDLQEVGNTVMNNLGIPPQSCVMGFHIPPFNSVYHLHLHVQALPYVSLRSAAKYPVRIGFAGYSKGLSWFAEVKQTIEILERGRREVVAVNFDTAGTSPVRLGFQPPPSHRGITGSVSCRLGSFDNICLNLF